VNEVRLGKRFRDAPPRLWDDIWEDYSVSEESVMFRNRFRQQAAPSPTPDPSAFLLCPLLGLPPLVSAHLPWQTALYEWAFAQAQAVARPSLPERDLLGVWN
jgi:hypothetical protein